MNQGPTSPAGFTEGPSMKTRAPNTTQRLEEFRDQLRLRTSLEVTARLVTNHQRTRETVHRERAQVPAGKAQLDPRAPKELCVEEYT